MTDASDDIGCQNCNDFLTLLNEPSSLGVALVSKNDEQLLQRKQLEQTCRVLFRRVETLAGLYKKHIELEGGNLTGLEDLVLGDGGGCSGNAEVLYGQVEVQNVALQQLLKSACKALSKAVESSSDIRLLGEDDSDEKEDKEKDGNDTSSDGGEESDGLDEEEDKLRIRARMKRAMDDMEEEEDDKEENDLEKSKQQQETDESSTEDPAAEELNDGFFDINEMEAFADEEEEYLPEEAFGEEKPENTESEDKRSIHQKNRDLDSDSGSENEAEEEELLFRANSSVRRRRYRGDDEINALYELYQNPNTNADSDDEENDPANMTAADIFGKPKKKYFDKWNERKQQAKTKKQKNENDSWNEYDFDSNKDEVVGWNDGDDESESKQENGSREGSDGDSVEEDGVANDKTSGRDNKPPAPTSRKQEKLKKQIDEIEREMISEKPWQMKGEVVGTVRPVDSLLESTPEFEVAAKQAPIITVERTANLEEVIKKRILEEDWDDVIPRELPDVAWNKKKGELPEVSQEKSKLGLGELYEREYLKKVIGHDVDAVEKETEEEKAKNEMRTLFANICSKLDALSNYHFAPRPIADELEVRAVSKPAIAMEEVLPLHVSDARGVAPEEVYGSKRGRDGVLRGESELEQQDRKRLRSAKKAARRKDRKDKLADEKLLSRLEPGLGLNNPYEKRKMREELSAARARGKVTTGEMDTKSYGKSSTFFKRMQDEAQQAIRGNTGPDEPEKKKRNSSALKL